MTPDLLTPEERAVIEAACAETDAEEESQHIMEDDGSPADRRTVDAWHRRIDAVRALRESRAKWREHRLVADALIGPHGRVMFVHEDAYKHISLALLNAGETALAKDGTDGRRTP